MTRCAAVAAAMMVCALVAAAQPAGMTSFRSRHYEVITDLERKDVEPIARHMDRVYEEYDRRFRDFPMRGSKAYPFYVFATRRRYLDHLKGEGIDASNTGGLFFRTSEGSGLATYVEGNPRPFLLHTLQHEGFHHFAHMRIGPDLPAWVNEGLAEYFGEAYLVKDRFVLGRVGEDRLARVKHTVERGESAPFGQLLPMSPAEWSSRAMAGDPLVLVRYDQAWSIVQFLIDGDGGRHQDMFVAYLKALGSGLQHRQAFARAFGTSDEAEFEKAWKRHVAALKPDPVSTAMVRLAFLAEGLARLHEARESPATFDDLAARLREAKFRTTRFSHSGYVAISAEQPGVFELPPEKEDSPAQKPELVAATDQSLPPDLRARVGRVSLTTVWTRDPSGELSFEIEAR